MSARDGRPAGDGLAEGDGVADGHPAARDGVADGGGLAGDDANLPAPALDRLRALLLDEGGLIASLVREGNGGSEPACEDGESPAGVAARGPRAERHREEYELLVEAIYEGYLLHYGVAARGAHAGGRPARAGRRPAVRDRPGAAGRRWATPRRWPSWPTRSR